MIRNISILYFLPLCCVLFLLTGFTNQLIGQEEEDSLSGNYITDYPQRDYTDYPIEVEVFDRQQWKKLVQDLDYYDDYESYTKANKQAGQYPAGKYSKGGGKNKHNGAETNSQRDAIVLPAFFSQLINIVVILCFILLLAYLLSNFLDIPFFMPNKKVIDPETLNILEDIEKNIHDVPLEQLLNKVLEAGDYKMAIRIHYLIIIKKLSDINWIRWKKHKTNLEYRLEMRKQNDAYDVFSDLTNIFEGIWYGEMDINKKDYNLLAGQFRQFTKYLSE